MRLLNKPHTEHPALAPLDPLGREIQQVLELIMPLEAYERTPRYDGYCGVASEAYLHLAGGRDADVRVMRAANGDGSSHWWLMGPRGVIDLTLGPADRRRIARSPRTSYPYETGRGKMFQNGYARPSKRAAAIIALVRLRRRAAGRSSPSLAELRAIAAELR